MKFLFIIAVWLVCILTDIVTQAQQFDVFYLSVGSADYISDKSKIKSGSTPFAPVTGARKSARYVSELLQQNANGTGVMLRSESGKYVTRQAVFNGLDQVIEMAKKSKSKNPLLVFYFCGHGVSEGIAWNQFLVPGDFTEKPNDLAHNPLAINIEELGGKLIWLGDITDKLDDTGIPYLCLIDACYEGAKEEFSSLDLVMTETGKQNLKDAAKILRFMNEYHEANPVVFATRPGTTTQVVEDPLVNEGSYIGPLCRRLMLVKNKLKNIPELTLMDLVVLLDDNSLDEVTKSAVSNCEFNDTAMKVLFKMNN